MSLNATDLQKLVKLLGMIGSDHDGEALSAAIPSDKTNPRHISKFMLV
jgi:hypothetical protein